MITNATHRGFQGGKQAWMLGAGALAAMAVSSAGAVSAATITWGTVTTLTGPQDVSTSGTLVGAWDPGTASGGYAITGIGPVNGVTFSATLPANFASSSSSYYHNTTIQAQMAAINSSSAYANYGKALTDFVYGTSATPGLTLAMGGLTAGNTYQVQAWVVNGSGFGETISGSAGDSSYIGPGYLYKAPTAAGGGYMGAYVLGTFIADSTGAQTLSFTEGSGGHSPQLNMVQLRDTTPTPEPATLGLMALGGLGLLLLKPRKRGGCSPQSGTEPLG